MIYGTYSLLMLAAEATSPAAGKQGGDNMFLGLLVPLGIIFAVMYIFVFAPQRKKEKRRRSMLDQIAKGDDIVTIGGIRGKVWQVKDQEVVVTVSENIKMTFSRGAIARIEKGEELQK